VRPGSAAWLERLGAVAAATGSDGFLLLLLGLFGALLRHDMSLVVRYARFAAPDFLVSERYPQHIIDLYRSGYYRFDPFYGYWQDHERCGVVSLRDVAPPGLGASRYGHLFHRQIRISDELGMFLPGVGRSSIALFLERSSGRFTQPELDRARRVYPAIAGLYRAHVGRIFTTLGEGTPGAGRAGRPALLVDSADKRVYASPEWRGIEEAVPEVARALDELADGGAGPAILPGNRVMHVEALDAEFTLAPAGRMYVIEDRGLAPERLSPEEAVERMAAGLTPRERQIVALVLAGHGSEGIARRLGIGRGTVKNHRRRLYDKLDITTERELFLTYLDALTGSAPNAAVSAGS
jgi:DNA-binding CsgD family transcriptional regulator